MLETLLLDEDSLLLTWFISTFLQIFNAVLCNFLELFFVLFFHRIRLFLLVLQQSFELLHISCFSSFSWKLVPWFCHSHTEAVSSHLCPCVLVDQVEWCCCLPCPCSSDSKGTKAIAINVNGLRVDTGKGKNIGVKCHRYPITFMVSMMLEGKEE